MEILSMLFYQGRNVFSHRPVLKVLLDMGNLYQQETKLYQGFEEKLLNSIPSLINHHCSRGKQGGLVERMREGTYFSHVTEHVILELLALAGLNSVWGKTFRGSKDNTYSIVVECSVKEAGEKAALTAVELVNKLLNNEIFDLKEHIAQIAYLNSEYGFGPSTSEIIMSCKKRGIPYLTLPDGIIQLAYSSKKKRIFGTLVENVSCLACDIASDKNLTKELLKGAGLPIVQGKIVRNEQEAIEASSQIGFPVVVKPNNGNHGRGVSVNLNSVAEVRAAYKLAYMHDKTIILEKYLRGQHFRFLLIKGSFKACAERIAPFVVGDGIKRVRELIEDLNADPRRAEGHGSIRSKIMIDPELILTITKQKKNLDDILPIGEVLILRENANLSSGAGADDVTSKVHPSFVQCAETAAKVIGVDIAGIDMVAEDISKPISQQNTAIIEVNASPGIRMHLFPDNGQPQPIGDEIVKMMFPDKASWHIPIVAITGTNGKTTTTRLIGSILSKSQEKVGMTTTGGIFIDGTCIMKGDTTGPESAKTVLKHPDVTAAVLETARGGILRSGLGYDLADVAVVTNITEDHLGQDGIETLEDLAHIKALVAEAVRPEGTVVLNADDEHCCRMAKKVRANISYFSVHPNNRTVCRHLAAGGSAYYIWNGKIIYASGDHSEVICSISDIPITYGGRAQHNVSNVLAAIAATKVLGVKNDLIVETLLSFGRSPSDNPGRLHIEEVSGTTVIVDYGHNLAGYKWTAKFARTLDPRKLIGVIGVPGDRNDESIIKVGTYAGKAFDEIWIKEDVDLRGRKNGEVAELLKKGAQTHRPADKIHICLKETEAVTKALSMSAAGDVVIVFYEEFEPVLDTIAQSHRVEAVSQ